MSYFPLKIKYRTGEIVIVKSPDDIKDGVPFVVLETKAKL